MFKTQNEFWEAVDDAIDQLDFYEWMDYFQDFVYHEDENLLDVLAKGERTVEAFIDYVRDEIIDNLLDDEHLTMAEILALPE